MTAYRPGMAKIGDPTPQTHPGQFSDADIMREIRYLLRLNTRYGSSVLRTIAYVKLGKILALRRDPEHVCDATILLSVPTIAMGAVTGWTPYTECGQCHTRRPQPDATPQRDRQAIAAMLRKRYRGAIEPTDAMIDAVIAGLTDTAGR